MTLPRHADPPADPTLRRLLRLDPGPRLRAQHVKISHDAAILCASPETSGITRPPPTGTLRPPNPFPP